MDTILRQFFGTAAGADGRIAILIAIAMSVYPTSAVKAGEIYRSVDAEGHVVYSDRPDTAAQQSAPVEIQSTEPVADIEQRASGSPPPLPDEQQPACPDEGYLWTPGYWAWNGADYYWIPGGWVEPPQLDVLWTPGYWEHVDTVYVFHRGYWAQHIGYYGGIHYGFGYFGAGYVGGRWINHSFAYNRSVSNVDTRVIRNTYSEAVNASVNRVSYNGGPGGTTSVMSAREKTLAAEKHFPATPTQRRNLVQAAAAPTLRPHMPISVYHTESSADHRNIEARQKPASLTAPTVTGSRAPPTSAAPVQPAIARPSKPAATRPAVRKPPTGKPTGV
jgi:hypothetical protein